MNAEQIRRALLCISTLSVIAGSLALIYSDFDFTGPGERALVKGDAYFISSLFNLNAFGGVLLVVAGVLGVVAALRGIVALAWVGAFVAGFGGAAVLVGSGDAETLVGQGNPSNAAIFFIVGVGLAVTAWATAADSRPAS